MSQNAICQNYTVKFSKFLEFAYLSMLGRSIKLKNHFNKYFESICIGFIFSITIVLKYQKGKVKIRVFTAIFNECVSILEK